MKGKLEYSEHRGGSKDSMKTAVSAGLTPLRVPQFRLGKSAISRDGKIKCKESESRFTSPFYLALALDFVPKAFGMIRSIKMTNYKHTLNHFIRPL